MSQKFKKKLLIVDDLEQVLEAYAELFCPYFEIKTAPTGEMALELFRSFHPEVIFLDVQLDGTNMAFQGPRLLKIFKSEKPETLVCIITANPELEKILIEEGADAFFDKLVSRGKIIDFLITKGILDPVQG